MMVWAVFPGRHIFQHTFFYWCRYFRFFSLVVFISFLSFRFVGPQTCRRLTRPRLCPQAVLYFVLTVLGHNPPRFGPFRPPRINGPGPQTNGPHNSPSKSCCPTFWSGEEDFDNAQPWLIRLGLLLVLASLHLPRKQIRLQNILTNSFVMRSRRLVTQNVPLMTYLYETT